MAKLVLMRLLLAAFVGPWLPVALGLGFYLLDSETTQEAFVPRPRPFHFALSGDRLKLVGWKQVSMSLRQMIMESFWATI